jgi:hypothetical protein
MFPYGMGAPMTKEKERKRKASQVFNFIGLIEETREEKGLKSSNHR